MRRVYWPLAILALLFAIASCGAGLAARAARAELPAMVPSAGSAIAAAVTPLPAPADTGDADAQIKHWKQVAADERANAETERSNAAASDLRAAAADRQGAIVQKEKAILILEAWQSKLAWTAGLMLVGILGCVALEFILPAGLRGWATVGILACTAVAIAAWILREVLPYLQTLAEGAAWSLVSGGGGYGLWRLWQFKKAGVQAADHGDRMEQALLGMRQWVDEKTGGMITQLVQSVKVDSAKLQTQAGVSHIVAHLRGKSPTTAKQLAAQPAVRAAVAVPPPARAASEAPTEILPAIADHANLTVDLHDLQPLVDAVPSPAPPAKA